MMISRHNFGGSVRAPQGTPCSSSILRCRAPSTPRPAGPQQQGVRAVPEFATGLEPESWASVGKPSALGKKTDDQRQAEFWARVRLLKATGADAVVKVVGVNDAQNLTVKFDGHLGLLPATKKYLAVLQSDGKSVTGRKLTVKIGEINEARDLVMFRDVPSSIPRDPAAAATYMAAFESMQEGQVLLGAVDSLVPTGAVVALGGGVRGSLSHDDISDVRVKDVPAVLAVGEVLQVVVLKKDALRGRLTLSTRVLELEPGAMRAAGGRKWMFAGAEASELLQAKDLGRVVPPGGNARPAAAAQPMSWEELRQLAYAGTKVVVTVTGANKSALSVRCGASPTTLGLIYLKDKQGANEALLQRRLLVTLSSADEAKNRLIFKYQGEPWPRTLKEGRMVQGVVSLVTALAAFVDLEGGVTGYLPLNLVSRKTSFPSSPRMTTVFAVGDPVKALVLKVDKHLQRAMLSTQEIERKAGDMLTNPKQAFETAEEVVAERKKRERYNTFKAAQVEKRSAALVAA